MNQNGQLNNIPHRGTVVTPDIYQQFNTMLKKQQLSYHQFYNTEIETDEFPFIKFMTKYKNSNTTKILNKTYYDIEVFITDENFPDPIEVNYEVNSISFYNNISNEAIIFYIYNIGELDEKETEQGIKDYYAKICKENEIYIIPDLIIKAYKCENERDLFIRLNECIKSFSTLMLIGFNSSIFDDPYVMNRGIKLFGEDRYYEMVSDFQVTKYSSRIYEVPDYLNVDLLNLYKSVDSGGMGFGKSLPNYKLNTIAKKELGINKLDLDDDFTTVYKNNPVQFFTYNMMDSLLVYKLDEKLRFIELIFSLSQYNNSTMGAAIGGRSIMYTYRNDLIYTLKDTLIRNKKYSKEVFYAIETEQKKR